MSSVRCVPPVFYFFEPLMRGGGERDMENWFEVNGTTLTVRLPAEIDHHNAEEIREEADRILQRRMIRSVVFDFGDTVFMDSSGVGMIMGRYKLMRFMGGDVTAVRANERMKKILKLSGICRLIDVYGGEDAEPSAHSAGRGNKDAAK